MTPDLERVARAILVSIWGYEWADINDDSPKSIRDLHETCEEAARAAVTALMEVSETMSDTGGMSIAHPSVYMGGPGPIRKRDATRHFQAMLRAVLGDEG